MSAALHVAKQRLAPFQASPITQDIEDTMAIQTKTPPIKQIDKRVADRYLRRGILADKDHKAYLAALPDLEGKYDVINSDLERPAKDESDA